MGIDLVTGDITAQQDCYANSLAVATELGARSVAFPLISSGVYRWPRDDAVAQALAVLGHEPALEVRLVLFDEETRRVAERVRQDGSGA